MLATGSYRRWGSRSRPSHVDAAHREIERVRPPYHTRALRSPRIQVYLRDARAQQARCSGTRAPGVQPAVHSYRGRTGGGAHFARASGSPHAARRRCYRGLGVGITAAFTKAERRRAADGGRRSFSFGPASDQSSNGPFAAVWATTQQRVDVLQTG
jgi:hypothetical protein